MTTSESKGRFFYKTNLFESIRTTNRIDSNRELECSTVGCLRIKISVSDQILIENLRKRKSGARRNCLMNFHLKIVLGVDLIACYGELMQLEALSEKVAAYISGWQEHQSASQR